MKQLNSRELCKLLRQNGYSKVRTNGSHQIWCNGKQSVPVPVVKLNFKLTTKIIKECGLVV